MEIASNPISAGIPAPSSQEQDELSTLEAMLSISAKLPAIAAGMKLTVAQQARYQAFRSAIRLYRDFIRPVIKRRSSPEFDGLTNMQARARKEIRRDEAHPYAMTEEEIQSFEQLGMFGPFDVVDSDYALQLGRRARGWLDTEFAEENILSPAQLKVARNCPDWGIRKAGFFQAWRMQELFDLHTSPQIGQRLASLLGDDVLLWRSQFFEKPPGATGTFWHQTATFREADIIDKLEPPNLDMALWNLTVWIALSETSVENGTLVILPGSFEDARVESLYMYAAGHTVDFMADIPKDRLDDILKVALFHNCQFTKIQALFDASLGILGDDIFESHKMRALTMKPGQAVIFTSVNMHGSYPNITKDDCRVSAVGRYTPGDAKILRKGQNHIVPTTHAGDLLCPVDHIPAIQVHGKHTSGKNAVIDRPMASIRPPA